MFLNVVQCHFFHVLPFCGNSFLSSLVLTIQKYTDKKVMLGSVPKC